MPEVSAAANTTSSRRAAAVFVGGMVGGGARIGVSVLLDGGATTPWGTLAANVTGALLLGYLLTRVLRSGDRTGLALPLLGTGVLGSYTTFSAFSLEVWHLLQVGRPVLALVYATASLALGLGAAVLGMRLGERRP